MSAGTTRAGRGAGAEPLAAARMPELRLRGQRWMSFSCEEAIIFVQEALGREDRGLEQIRIVLEGTHRAPLPDLAEDEKAVQPPSGTPLRIGQEIQLRVRRPGLFERFPRSFFSEPDVYEGSRPISSVAGLGENDKNPADQLDEDEAEARLLFQPFDRELMFLRAEVRRWEAVFAGVYPESRYHDFIQRAFGLSAGCRKRIREMLSPQAQTILTFLLPHLHGIAGDRRRVEQVLGLFVPDRLRLVEGPPLDYVLPPDGRLHLGPELRLGERALGDRIVSWEKVAVLEVGPIPPERMAEYRSPAFVSLASGPLFELGAEEDDPAGWGGLASALRFLCGLFLPADLRVMLQPRPASLGWKLGAEGRGRCGIDTLMAVSGRTET